MILKPLTFSELPRLVGFGEVATPFGGGVTRGFSESYGAKGNDDDPAFPEWFGMSSTRRVVGLISWSHLNEDCL